MKKKLILGTLMVFCASMIATPLSASAGTSYEVENIRQVVEEFNLEKVDYEVPEDAKVLKFDTAEQAEKFLSVLMENEESGVLDLKSVVSNDELKEDTIDLSNTNISENNFVKDEDVLVANQSAFGMGRAINTVEHYSRNIGGTSYINIDASATYDWKSGVGNHYTKCSAVSSYMSGFYLGSAWNQSSYSSNITNNGKTLSVNVRGYYDYYILINTSLTHLGGATRTYSTSWTLR